MLVLLTITDIRLKTLPLCRIATITLTVVVAPNAVRADLTMNAICPVHMVLIAIPYNYTEFWFKESKNVSTLDAFDVLFRRCLV